MNKEIESIINYYINNDVARDKVRDYIEELQNKKDKAIEYIEWQRANPQYDNVWRGFECDSLIEILKEGDADE